MFGCAGCAGPRVPRDACQIPKCIHVDSQSCSSVHGNPAIMRYLSRNSNARRSYVFAPLDRLLAPSSEAVVLED